MRLLSLAALFALGPAAPVEQPAAPSPAAPTAVEDPAGAPAPETPSTMPEAPEADETPEAEAAPLASPEATPTPEVNGEPTHDELAHDDERRAALERRLGCGLLVITVQDDSLPVAAVVLSVESGSRDDPENLPGFTHAMAFDMMGGNREVRPGQALGDVHDFGGIASMGFGPAQTRYESLVPYSQLDRILDLEAERFRAPSLSQRVWLKHLNYARRDTKPRLPLTREAWAAAWDDPALSHEGRQVPKALSQVVAGVRGAQISKLFNYQRATLVVVGPESPEALMQKVVQRFEDLPNQTRAPSSSPQPWAHGPAASAPREVPIPRQKGDTLVWPVPSSPAARAYAQLLCTTLARMPADAGEPKSAKVRCTYWADPRRPVLIVRGTPADPIGSIQSRLDHVRAGQVGALLSKQAKPALQRTRTLESRPMSLAIAIAQGEHEAPEASGSRRVAVESLTGSDALQAPTSVPSAAEWLLDTRNAVRLVAAPASKKPAPAKGSK